jgi:hypothetical protein
MKRIGYKTLVGAFALTLTLGAASAQAYSVNPNGVHFITRIFNDCPASTVTTDGSAYPATVFIDDTLLPCSGFANLHVWQFSTDGGATGALIDNWADFSFTTTMVLGGNDANGSEAGVNIAPWWFVADGRINCRIPDGEIAAFGGRMPFYSWTDPSHGGLHYVANTPITLTMTYHHNGLTSASPGTIEYNVFYGGNNYPAGPFALDQGNPGEDPPHGLWGILSPASAGGYLQARLDPGNFQSTMRATWTNTQYTNYSSTTAAEKTSWGKLKSLYR